jgi:hypothetical protein
MNGWEGVVTETASGPADGQRKGSQPARARTRLSGWEFLLVVSLSLAGAFALGLWGPLAVRMWAAGFEVLGILAVALQIADAELLLIDGQRNWLWRERRAWTRARTGIKKVAERARSLGQKVAGWLRVRRSVTIEAGFAAAGVSGVSCNAEAVWDWSIKPVEAETVGELVIQVNEQLARISERFQRLDEDADQKVKNLARQMAANDDALRADLRGSVDGVRRLIDSIQIGGARWAKRGLLALVIGTLIGLFATQIAQTVNPSVGTSTPPTQSQSADSRP